MTKHTKRRGENKRRKRMESKFIPDPPWGGLFTHPAYLWQAKIREKREHEQTKTAR
ncbi:MAG: hypothetical protein WBQ13_12195 [Terriglobales bacterium]